MVVQVRKSLGIYIPARSLQQRTHFYFHATFDSIRPSIKNTTGNTNGYEGIHLTCHPLETLLALPRRRLQD